MKNHALNPSVVTYEHDTRRRLRRHAFPPSPPLSQLWTPYIYGVCDPSICPFYHPILMPGCIYFGPNLGCCSRSLLFFLAAHFGGVPCDAH